MTPNAHDGDVVNVSFDNGQVIQASYVIGADGARLAVRQLAGIGFANPNGQSTEWNNLAQMVLADVTFLSPIKLEDGTMGVISQDSLSIIIPLTSPMTDYQQFNHVCRIGRGVPILLGAPPHALSTAYLQDLFDEFGPIELSSDSSVNPNPVCIIRTLWSSRFRMHSAAADRFFTRFATDDSAKFDKTRGAVIILIDNAAHIHSPAGGQGMNLGLRDAMFLGPIIAAHIKQQHQYPPSSITTTTATESSDPDAI